MSNTDKSGSTMLDMAKRKPTQPEPKDDAPGDFPMSLRLDPDLHEALKRFVKAQKFKTSKTDVIEVAIQELLKAEGFWPPPDDK